MLTASDARRLQFVTSRPMFPPPENIFTPSRFGHKPEPSMLAALLTAAQAEKLLTVRDVQAMLTDAGCPESSRGHAHSLMVGACQPTPHEFMAIVSHLGCEMLAYAAARAAGGSYAPVTATRAEPMASAIAAIGDAHALVSDLHAAMADGVVTQIEHARLERAATTLRDDAARVAGAVDALVVGGAK